MWDISDETLIKLKVFQVVDRMVSGITIGELYNPETEAECLAFLNDLPGI